jgi:hypothetical protein
MRNYSLVIAKGINQIDFFAIAERALTQSPRAVITKDQTSHHHNFLSCCHKSAESDSHSTEKDRQTAIWFDWPRTLRCGFIGEQGKSQLLFGKENKTMRSALSKEDRLVLCVRTEND